MGAAAWVINQAAALIAIIASSHDRSIDPSRWATTFEMQVRAPLATGVAMSDRMAFGDKSALKADEEQTHYDPYLERRAHGDACEGEAPEAAGQSAEEGWRGAER